MNLLYNSIDGAYDAGPIRALCKELGMAALIDTNPRGKEKIPMDPASAQRDKTRSMSKRVNSQLKESFVGRTVRVQGPVKVFAHLMFGVLALSATQLLRLGTTLSSQGKSPTIGPERGSRTVERGEICRHEASQRRFWPEKTRK